MSSLCRLCLSEGGPLTDISETREGLQISVIAMIICPVKIENEDNLPKEVCHECLRTILDAYKLRDVSNNTERYLRSCHDHEDNFNKNDCDDNLKEDILVAELDIDTNTITIINDEILPEGDQDEEESEEKDYILYDSGEEEEIIEESDVKPTFKFSVDCSKIENKTSAVWNYFGTLTDEEGKAVKEEKDSYFCTICVEDLKTLKPKYKIESTATSVLFSHLSRVHGINKEDMIENSHVPTPNVPELVTCKICEKSLNAGSLNIHMAIEHENGVATRLNERISSYKVNCFKNSSKSLAWDYFGVLENLKGEQIDAYYYYCRLCVEEEDKLNPKYTKNTSTSILLQHLKNAHIPKDPVEASKRKMLEPIYTDTKRTKNEEFSCHICFEGLESRRALNRHMSREHQEEQPKNFQCDYENCNKTFSHRDALLKHFKHTHSGSKFSCNLCPAELASKMSLQRHIQCCHLKVKNFTCDQCASSYTEHKSLKNHIQKVHLKIDNKKVPCDLCELRFPNQWSLRRHLLTHTGEKPHKCSDCGKSYTCKGDLTNHKINIHNNNVYNCEYPGCTEAFKFKVDVMDHYKVHYTGEVGTHNNDVYNCEYPGCNEGFKLKVDLMDHYKVHYLPDHNDVDNDESSQYFEDTEEFIE